MEKNKTELNDALLDKIAGGAAAEEVDPWDCLRCGQTGNTGYYCIQCQQAWGLNGLKRTDARRS